MEITPLSIQIVHLDLDATEYDGDSVSIDGVIVALAPLRSDVDSTTEWVAATTWDAATNEGTVLVAGYDTDTEGALVVPSAGADLYARVVDNPEDLPRFIERITYG